MPNAIDLFCGAGGLSEGFRQAGFTVLAGNDFDALAGETFTKTHPDAKFIPGPIEKLSAKDFLVASGLKIGELDCLVGGPPCQAFSVYNHKRGMHDERSGLFREYLRIVDGIKPKWVVMENVTGILSVGKGEAVRAIQAELGRLGYEVKHHVLKSEEYGVPQERRRVFFVANRVGLTIAFPEPTHGAGRTPFVTVWDAIGDLPALKNGEDRGDLSYAIKAANSYQREIRRGSRIVCNHSSAKLSEINIERMKHIPQGGSWRNLPFDLLPEGMKRAKRSDHTKRYGRLRQDGLASTILTKCDLHWGAFVHPTQNRILTVREAARLQSFPDIFHFAGPRTEQYVQVGNAVPPLLAKCVAKTIMSTWRASKNVAVHRRKEIVSGEFQVAL